jgi:hypothetical protein
METSIKNGEVKLPLWTQIREVNNWVQTHVNGVVLVVRNQQP